MNILAVSDVEIGYLYSPMILDKCQNIDLILSCGDLPYYYLEYILTMLNVPCYYVRGNHSSPVEYGLGVTRKSPLGAVDLHQHCTRTKSGLLLAGLEGSLRYNRGAHQYTQAEYWDLVFRLVPRFLLNKAFYGRYLDIFISHAPPWHIHDEDDLPHQGIKAFRWLITVFQPQYFLHGHVHVYRMDAVTRTMLGKTAVMNVYGQRQISIEVPRVPSRQKSGSG